MNKKIIFTLLLVVLLGILIFISFNSEPSPTISESNFTEQENKEGANTDGRVVDENNTFTPYSNPGSPLTFTYDSSVFLEPEYIKNGHSTYIKIKTLDLKLVPIPIGGSEVVQGAEIIISQRPTNEEAVLNAFANEDPDYLAEDFLLRGDLEFNFVDITNSKDAIEFEFEYEGPAQTHLYFIKDAYLIPAHLETALEDDREHPSYAALLEILNSLTVKE